jgi:HD domain
MHSVIVRCLPALLCAALLNSGGSVRAAKSEGASVISGGWRTAVREFAAEHFKNPAWGYSHSVRDYQLARGLAMADHAKFDDDVLYAAAYLHDIAAFPPWADPKVDHADEGARIVDQVLKGTGFPMAKIDAVRGAIRTHMYDRDPAGVEALYLHDADALDWLGAVGAARVIAAVPDFIPMLESNLAKVPSRVLSPAGRTQVEQRRSELDQFLRDLRRESNDLRDL